MNTDQLSPPNNWELIIERTFLANGFIKEAKEKLKQWGLLDKWGIENGKLIDISNLCEMWLGKFITVDPEMLELKEDVRKLSLVQDEVLIEGDTGTGKELIARALHGNREGKYQAINCAGIPENLIESILFGHVQGAFTGALRARDGLMLKATNGTLFLDEIGELPLDLQGKLLRAIQEKEITPVGGDKDIAISCRIICATNKDMMHEVDEGSFRADLYARLSTFELKTKNLKDRQNDIVPILKSLPGGNEFLTELVKIDIQPADLKVPFNVRSLQRYVKRYKVLGKL